MKSTNNSVLHVSIATCAVMVASIPIAAVAVSAIVFSVTMFCASNSYAVTITNASFEDVSGMSCSISSCQGRPVGWSFTNNKVQVYFQSFFPLGALVDGNRYLESFNSDLLGTLSQDVTGLSIGQEYELSFVWGNRIFAFNMTVEMGGGSFSTSGPGALDMVAESFVFTATSTTEDLNITWHNGTIGSGAFDAFEITEVTVIPEPTTCVLALAALCLALSRRRDF